ncbi:tetratricopeptide repeat protein [Shewanella sp. 202IG2-18]|uniref:tetratricopeptide repeat protein n=1 Tax=Parashewanella hymeniacidonis TaxID=2807618 RepID=UPI00195F32DE|nr:tetratricopeptide repeat protein [Parashewanella hymeniacidonis]MBM7072299.1 tetratricopeptide repeat protein [Parashewanella hymeniacidonis]
MKTLLLVTSILTSSSVFALTTEEAITATDNAMDTLNIQKLQQLATETSDYANAYANYRLGVTANLTGNTDKAQLALSKAAEILEQLNQSQANAENYALLSLVYGMNVYIDNSLSASLGMKSGQALEQALTLEPNNPRVELAQGISTFHKPQKSISFINAAIADFSQPCTEICWGSSEAYVWRGLAKQQLGDQAAAHKDWQQALAVNPNNGWAKGLLGQY